jgi:hypothetical protein
MRCSFCGRCSRGNRHGGNGREKISRRTAGATPGLRRCDVLVVGGGLGGCAAALAASALGARVLLVEEYPRVGGQLTTQAVPPDEHPWIESFGCTRRYRELRNRIRQLYRDLTPLTSEARANEFLNPGGGWVSKLCHEPRFAERALLEMLAAEASSGRLEVRTRWKACGCRVEGDVVHSVVLRDLATGREETVEASYVIDATETGDLLPMTGTEFVNGAESRDQTGEPNAAAVADPQNVQAITWVFAMAHDKEGEHIIPEPASYKRWRSFRPPFWPGPLIGEWDLNPVTKEPRLIPILSESGLSYFTYRQVVDPSIYEAGYAEHPVTLVNWPMNDYFVGSVVDVPEHVAAQRMEEARQLSLCVLYWLQTEMGLPGMMLRPDVAGSADGLAQAPYIRESRRIAALRTVVEADVSSDLNPGLDRAPEMPDSVGVGYYRIDLHPSTGGDSYIDVGALPFQIPLSALVPVRMRNLLPGCKNLGVTHVTNGCYRLHPVEWNVGEAAGALAAYCLKERKTPAEVASDYAAFQELLRGQGVELEWPRGRPLTV